MLTSVPPLSPPRPRSPTRVGVRGRLSAARSHANNNALAGPQPASSSDHAPQRSRSQSPPLRFPEFGPVASTASTTASGGTAAGGANGPLLGVGTAAGSSATSHPNNESFASSSGGGEGLRWAMNSGTGLLLPNVSILDAPLTASTSTAHLSSTAPGGPSASSSSVDSWHRSYPVVGELAAPLSINVTPSSSTANGNGLPIAASCSSPPGAAGQHVLLPPVNFRTPTSRSVSPSSSTGVPTPTHAAYVSASPGQLPRLLNRLSRKSAQQPRRHPLCFDVLVLSVGYVDTVFGLCAMRQVCKLWHAATRQYVRTCYSQTIERKYGGELSIMSLRDCGPPRCAGELYLHSMFRLALVSSVLPVAEVNLKGLYAVTLGFGIQHLARYAPRAKSVNFSNCAGVDDRFIKLFAKHNGLHHGLRAISVAGASRLTDAVVGPLASLSRLRAIDLSGCLQLTDGGARQLHPMRQLQALSLKRCCRISDAALGSLFRRLTHLQVLNAQHTACGPLAVKSLARVAPLRDLDLSNCGSMTDDALRDMADRAALELRPSGDQHLTNGTEEEKEKAKPSGFAALTQLRLAGCRNITAAGVVPLLPLLPALERIDLDNCPKVVSAAVRPALLAFEARTKAREAKGL